MLEAIKARNVLVVERFKYSREASQSIISLALEVEEALESFKETITQFEWSSKKERKEFFGIWQIFTLNMQEN